MTIITSIRAAMRLLFLTGQNTSTRSGVSSIFGPTLNADIASKPRQLCVPNSLPFVEQYTYRCSKSKFVYLVSIASYFPATFPLSAMGDLVWVTTYRAPHF